MRKIVASLANSAESDHSIRIAHGYPQLEESRIHALQDFPEPCYSSQGQMVGSIDIQTRITNRKIK